MIRSYKGKKQNGCPETFAWKCIKKIKTKHHLQVRTWEHIASRSYVIYCQKGTES